MSLTTQRARITGVRSVQDSNIGWFPSGLHAKTSTHNVDPWVDGALFSELVAILLVDDRSLVKEVEQYDEFGRVRGPPKLVLNGTETQVKSKAQAIQNLRLCIRALEKIPNFPHIAVTAEDLFESPKIRSELLHTISMVFQLPDLTSDQVEPPKQLARVKSFLVHRSSSAPPRLTQQRFPHMRRSADPILQSQSQRPPKRRTLSSVSVDEEEFLTQRNTLRNRSARHSQNNVAETSRSIPRSRSFDQGASSSPVRGRSASPSVRSSGKSILKKSHTTNLHGNNAIYVSGRSRSPSTSKYQYPSASSSRASSPQYQRGNYSDSSMPYTQKERYFKDISSPSRWHPSSTASAAASMPTSSITFQPGRVPGRDIAMLGRSETPTRLREKYAKELAPTSSAASATSGRLTSKPGGKSVTSSPAAEKLQRTRALEMRRERMKVQLRDRRTRHSQLIEANRAVARQRDLLQQQKQLQQKQHQQQYPSSDVGSRAESAVSRKSTAVSQLSMDCLRTGKHLKRANIAESHVSRDPQRQQDEPQAQAGYNSDSNHSAKSHETQATHASTRSLHTRRTVSDWTSPKPSTQELEAAKVIVLEPITSRQQSLLRDWLCSLGVSLLEGEGGFFWQSDMQATNSVFLPATASAAVPSSSSSSSAGRHGCQSNNNSNNGSSSSGVPMLPLGEDRLRNGRLWCELFCVLEPAAAEAAQLPKLLARLSRRQQQHGSLSSAQEVVRKALWLWRLRVCPPLPVHWFVRTDAVIAGDKLCIWGLLFQLMQLYQQQQQQQQQQTQSLRPLPYIKQPRMLSSHATTAAGADAASLVSTATTHAAASVAPNSLAPHVSHSKGGAGIQSFSLGYTLPQRRALDQSLLQWLYDTDVLQGVTGALPGRRPASLLALQSFCRDGSLFFAVAQQLLQLLHLPVSLPHRTPHSFAQCVANLHCVLEALRRCRDAPRCCIGRSSTGGGDAVAEAICRGHWDLSLGLLEDMRVLHDHFLRCRRQEQDGIGGVGGGVGRRLSISSVRYPYLGPDATEDDDPHLENQPLHSQHANQFNAPPDVAVAAAAKNGTKINVNKVLRLDQLFPSSGDRGDADHPVHDATAVEAASTAGAGVRNAGTNSTAWRFRHPDVVSLQYDVAMDPADASEHEDRYEHDFRTSGDGVLIGAAGAAVPSSAHPNGLDSGEEEDRNAKLPHRIQQQPHSSHDSPRKTINKAKQRSERYRRSHRRPPSDSDSDADEYDNDDTNSKQNEKESNSDSDASDSDHSFDLLREHSSPGSHPYADTVPETTRRSTDKGKPTPTSSRASKAQAITTPSTATTTGQYTAGALAQWLTELLQLSSRDTSLLTAALLHSQPASSSSPSSMAPTTTLGQMFADGVWLGRIVQRLERTEIAGFVARPVHPAQRWQNLRRALECLASRNRKLPLRLLSCEESLASGEDDAAVLTLLQGLRRAYVNHKS